MLIDTLLRDEAFLRRIITGGIATKRTLKTRFKSSDLKRNRGYGLEEMNNLERFNPKAFCRMFRLKPETFNWLLSNIEADLLKLGRSSFVGLSTLSDSVIEPEVKLACTLR